MRDVIVISGLTGSGKSDLAIALARGERIDCAWLPREVVMALERLPVEIRNRPGEIVNADMTQLYDELRILTAFPSESDFAMAPHHLFGILSPDHSTSAAEWLQMAVEKISEIHQRGFIPIVCGGTSFYIDALIDGLAEIPVIPDDFRSEISMQLHTMGRQAFFEQLQRLDPELGRILHPNDTQRILRASEVVQFTGIPLSQWWKKRTSSDFVFHHICIDAVSVVDFLALLGKIYDQIELDGSFPELEMPLWKDSVERMESEQAVPDEKSLNSWLSTMNSSTSQLIFSDTGIPMSYSFDYESFELGEELMEQINGVARQNGVTPFLFILSAWMFVLNRSTGQNDIFVETPINQRPTKSRNLIGFFVNSLPLAIDFDGMIDRLHC